MGADHFRSVAAEAEEDLAGGAVVLAASGVEAEVGEVGCLHDVGHVGGDGGEEIV